MCRLFSDALSGDLRTLNIGPFLSRWDANFICVLYCNSRAVNELPSMEASKRSCK